MPFTRDIRECDLAPDLLATLLARAYPGLHDLEIDLAAARLFRKRVASDE
ncbi:MAG: hypothetical protein IJS46_04340 [Kiritimatiellae bacterium]|nr:hypothetical protein [Kiritimatiellia bacterium]